MAYTGEKTTSFTLKTLSDSVLGLRTAYVYTCTAVHMYSYMCSWCLKGFVYTGGLMHSPVHFKIQILGSLLCPKASWDQTSSLRSPSLLLKAMWARREVDVPWFVPPSGQSEAHSPSVPWGHSHVVRAAFHDYSLYEGVFTIDNPWTRAEFPLCLQRAKHMQTIVNNNII